MIGWTRQRRDDSSEDAMIRLGTVAAIGFDDFEPMAWLECYRQLGC